MVECGAADAEDAVQLMLMMLTSLVLLVKPGAVTAHNAQLPGACWWSVGQLMLMMLAGLGFVGAADAHDAD